MPESHKTFSADPVFAEWNKFRSNQKINSKIIKDYILRSWERSKKYGVPTDGEVNYQTVSDAVFEKALQENKKLLQVAKPIMDSVYKILLDSTSSISLASSSGIILYGQGISFYSHEKTLCSEEYMGTSAIATCLAENKIVSIIGAEHWIQRSHQFGCIAVPILDKEQKCKGIICLVSPKENYNPHTEGFIINIAKMIANELSLWDALQEKQIILNLIDEGIITFNQNGILKSITRQAKEILKLNTVQENSNILSYLSFQDSPPFLSEKFLNMRNEQISVVNKNGVHIKLIASCDKDYDSDLIVLTLYKQKNMQALANKISGASAKFEFKDILGNSDEIKTIIDNASTAAKSDITVLILGESGTGKELFAQAIHTASARRKGPFIAVNCGALPRELIQSELFGYTEGAFTGAQRSGKLGKFELADGGTIFLDEIGDMPLVAQVNLLRLLQSHEISPLGANKVRTVDVRVIAATNRNLAELVKHQLFREDLYYRLNVFSLELPPLRRRGKNEILYLAEVFLKKHAPIYGAKEFTEEAREFLKNYSWPGNIRELENVIERAACISKTKDIEAKDLRIAPINTAAVPTVQSAFEDTMSALKTVNDTAAADNAALPQANTSDEYTTLINILNRFNGNITKASQTLGYSRAWFYLKFQEYNIDIKAFRKKKKLAELTVFQTKNTELSQDPAKNLTAQTGSDKEKLLLDIIKTLLNK